MSNVKKLMMTAAAGGAGLNVEDVFSTYLYTGTNTTNAINNGIDLDGEGGIVWIKNRDQTDNHYIFGGESGNNWTKILSPNGNGYYGGATNIFDSVSSTGFTVKSDFGGVNTINENYVSWTFRKAPKFFDVVTYTGDGTAGREIAHNLGSVPGFIIVKKTNASGDWVIQHRSLGAQGSGNIRLNSTDAAISNGQHYWGNGTVGINPTSSVFTVDNHTWVNNSGDTYVAYLFAHNDGDGGFGPDGDADIIKCGSYTGNSNGEYDDNGTEINLGFEPQWVLIKSSTWGSGNWQIYDTMRGITARPTASSRDGADAVLYPNQSYAESGGNSFLRVTPTGFKLESDNYSVNASIHDYIYIAIRRGPMAVPESATDVFAIDTKTDDPRPAFISNFPVDMALWRRKHTTSNWSNTARLIQGKFLYTNSTASEGSNSINAFDYQDGWYDDQGADNRILSWMWRRAPNFFDVVAYTGTGSARTIDHNLGVAPEMMWVKRRDSSSLGEWVVWHSGFNIGKYLLLNEAQALPSINNAIFWNNTAPTDTVFSLGTYSNVNSSTYIAYLFASLDGVSKVGSYTGNGGTQTINCGFSDGARFVLIKRTSDLGDWHFWDTERGIVTGNDPFLELNTTNAQNSSYDSIDPHSSGFTINNTINTLINGNGNSYIFYAIA